MKMDIFTINFPEALTMNQNWKNLLRRSLAVLLCAVMLLPIFPVSDRSHAAVSAASYSPVYAAGVLSDWPYNGGYGSTLLTYDCGNGLSNLGTKSCIRIMRGTTVSEFNAYCSSLASEHTLTYAKDVTSNESTKNLFRKYVAKDGSYSFYVYYLPDYDEARIIVDTNRDTVEGFKYTEQPGATVTPKMVMWGLSTSGTGYHYETGTPYSTDQKNNGALTIIRMRDNSLFIRDGGHLTQMNDEAADELLAFCRELTGTTGTDKKMVINGWFITHSHDDHFMGFARFINKYHEHFDMKNVIYNIDIERTDWTRDIHDTMTNIAEYYPDVRYYKPHTGETFEIAGVTFDVLYTHEDALYPNSSYQLKVNDSDSGSTYRSFMYTSGTTSDFNDTSTVLRLTFPNGVDNIFYGDMNLAESILEEIYPTSALQADIINVPHHGFDSHPDIINYAKAKIYLYTQNKQCIYGTDDDVTTIDLYGTARSNLGSSSTDMKRNFLAMFPGMNVAKGVTPSVSYKIYWGGNETAIIDINSLANASTPSAIDNCVQTREAPSYPYTGWTIDALSDEPVFQGLISAEDEKVSEPVGVSTGQAWLIPSSEPLVQYDFYAIMSNKYGHIMSYDPVKVKAGPNPARSIFRDDDGDSMGTYCYYGGNILFDPASRNNAVWVMGQYAVATGGKEKPSGSQMAVNGAVNFGGGAIYQGIQLWKGVKGTHGDYWYSTGSSSDYRFVDYSKNGVTYSGSCWKTSLPAGNVNYILESFGNGTYLLYYKASSTDFRFLYCDQYGNWGIRRYANGVSDCRPASQIKNDLEELKIRLFFYRSSSTKSMAIKGPSTYYVNGSATASSVLEAVDHYITVYDPSAMSFHVPSSGTSAKVSHYRVAFADTFKAGVNGTYRVNIIYRNDNGSDTVVGTVNVVVDSHNWAEATCTSPKTCLTCGDTRGSALGHNYKDYVCSRCGHVKNITVYFDTSVKGWSTVNAHYWNAYGNTTTWPGKAMLKVSDSVYSLVIPGNMTGIIFNNGTYQTEDLTVPGDGYIHDGYQWVPYGDAFSTSFFVTGSGAVLGNWDADFPDGKMTNQGGGSFSVTFDNVPAGTHEYKVTNGTWDKSWGKGEGNFTFSINTPSNVTIKFNVNTNTTSLSVQCLHSYKAVVTAPTCTDAGFTTYSCACGHSYTGNETEPTGHSYTEKIIVSAACTKEGTKLYTCSGCGHSYSETIAATGHSYAAQVTAPNCTDAGYTSYTCSACGHSYKENGAPATGHSYDTGVITTAASCTEDGVKTYTCSSCRHSYTEAIAATGHAYTFKVTAPTCENRGYTTHTCGNCGNSYVTDQTAALGHSYSVKITTAPGCDSGGTKVYTCGNCGHTYTEALAATGHNYQSKVTAPTCDTKGYTTYTCPCGHSYTANEVPAVGHKYTGKVTAPTCTQEGYTTYTCSVCSHSYTDNKTPAAGHKAKTVAGYAATCTKTGLTDGSVCSVCGITLTERKSIPATGHSYKTVTADPTCTANGSKTETCANCGDVIKTEIPATGHSYAAKVTAPTCTKEGYTTHTCSSCSHSYVDSKVPATGHHYENYVCTGCGDVTNITVYFDNSIKCWDSVNAHYWNTQGDTTTWPGLAMTQVSDWVYSITIPGNMPGIIFNNGTYQTDDLTVPGDGYAYDGYQWVPYGNAFTTAFYVTGSGAALGEWDADFPKGRMTNLCNGSFSVTFERVPAGTHEYKVTNGTWDQSWGKGEGNFSFTVKAPSNVTVIFDVNTNTTSISVECLHDYQVQVVAPTCTEGGYTKHTCVCGSSYVDNKTDAAGHSYILKVTKAPTCTQTGLGINTCAVCGDTGSAVIPATGHSYKDVITAPTCTQEGFTTHTCENCGNSYTDSKTAALGHSYDKGVITTAPGCETPGVKTFTCGTCGSTKTQTVEATGHKDKAVVTAPTCTQEGYTTYTCEYCGDSYTDNRTAALGHRYDEGVITIVPGCETEGITTFTCEICGDTKTERAEATKHSYVAKVTAPTCTEPGFTTHTCTRCGGSYTDSRTAPLGHRYDKGVITTAPGCETEGEELFTCAVCGSTKTEAVAALGHSYRSQVTAPTCEKEGYTTHTCSGCGNSYTDNRTAALGHSYDKGVITVAPDCDTAGEKLFTCGTCGHIRTEKEAALGHRYQSGVTTPSCTQQGCTTHTCIVCGDSYSENFIAALGHSYDEGVITTQPGCETEGIKTFTCAACGGTETEPVSATGHNYTVKVTAPTCTQEGFTTHTCGKCGHSYTDNRTAALGHACMNGICTVCNWADPDYVAPENKPVIKLRYPTLSFKDEILLNVYFEASNMDDVVEAGLILYSSQVTSWNIHNAESVVPGYQYNDAKELYFVTTKGIPAKNMGDTLWFAIYTKLSDGTCYYTKLVDYSPRYYAYSLLGSGDAALDALLVSMLNYGAAAQTYFDYNTDDLVNKDLTAEQMALAEDYRSDMMSEVSYPSDAKQGTFIKNGGYVDCYPSVTFGGAFSINYYYVPSHTPADGITMYYWKEADYAAADVLTAENATGMVKVTDSGSGVYRAAVTGIAAKNIEDAVYAAFVYSDGTTTYASGVLPYSIGTYCNTMANDPNGFDSLAKATAVYGYSAKQYFSNQ